MAARSTELDSGENEARHALQERAVRLYEEAQVTPTEKRILKAAKWWWMNERYLTKYWTNSSHYGFDKAFKWELNLLRAVEADERARRKRGR